MNATEKNLYFYFNSIFLYYFNYSKVLDLRSGIDRSFDLQKELSKFEKLCQHYKNQANKIRISNFNHLSSKYIREYFKANYKRLSIKLHNSFLRNIELINSVDDHIPDSPEQIKLHKEYIQYLEKKFPDELFKSGKHYINEFLS